MGHRPRRRVLALAGALALFAGIGGASIAGAQGSGACQSESGAQFCVLLIQVDGLEAQDVTREKMPFTWALATGEPFDPQGEGAPMAALGERDAWTWQAPRAAMTGLAANTVSLLTGGYPQQHGVPSDEFDKIELVGPEDEDSGDPPTFPGSGSEHVRLESDDDDLGDAHHSLGSNDIGEGTQTLLDLVDDDGGKPVAIVGDPDLDSLIPTVVDGDRRWAPSAQSQDQPGDQYYDPANFAYCDVKREVSSAEPPVVDYEDQELPACAVGDETTLRKAYDVLSTQNQGGDSRLAWIELAEIGHVKRLAPDQEAINSVLARTDLALAEFFNRYNSPQSAVTSGKWPNTVVFLVGSGGYELAENYVRDPSSASALTTATNAGDLAAFVEASGDDCKSEQPCFKLMPQGTVGTVYYRGYGDKEQAKNPTPEHREKTRALREEILSLNGTAACDRTLTGFGQLGSVAQFEDCIEEVLYMRPELAPPGQKDQTVQAQHPDWNLDHEFFDIDRDTFEEIRIPTGRSGDLLVVMAPGWKTGRILPGAQSDLLLGLLGTGKSDRITNPYPASAGGPRSRSIAAIVNGPSDSNGVRKLTNFDRYPVGTEFQGGPDAPKPDCPATNITPKYTDQPGNPAVVQANSPEHTDLGDDANAPGHECQAEIADIGLSIAGLMKLPVRFQQIGGRLLYEAFDDGVMPPTIGERPKLLQPNSFLTAGPLVAGPGQDLPHNFDGLPVFGFVVQPDKGEIVYECILLPGQFSHTELPETGWFPCGDPPSTRPDLCQNVTDEDSDGEPDRKSDGSLILAPFPCHSHAVSPALDVGVYTFSMKASNESEDPPKGPQATSTATFRVAEIPKPKVYECHSVLCQQLKAFVSNEKGRPFNRAKRGSKLNSITLRGGFGERHTAVDLTFYKKKQLSKRAKRKLRRKVRRARRNGRAADKVKLERVSAIADFEPFVLNLEADAKAKLTLSVPRRYKPTHIGIQLRKLSKRGVTKRQLRVCQQRSDTPSLCQYRKVGRCSKSSSRNRVCVNDLKPIRGAKYLHTVRGKAKGRRGKGRRGRRARRAHVAIAEGRAFVPPGRVEHRTITLEPRG